MKIEDVVQTVRPKVAVSSVVSCHLR